MPPAPPGPEPPHRRVRWQSATRIIAARFPPIDLFERVSPDPSVRDALIEAEQKVNPRLRDEIGEIRLVPPEDRVSGPGAGYVMASFTHLNPKGSRFSDGAYGVYYAAREIGTAIRETAFHFARFAADSEDGPRYEDMRVLAGRIDRSRPFAAALRDQGSNGHAYPSVRNPGGQCVAAFRPNAVGLPVQTNHLNYHWDGTRVVRYFDYAAEEWIPLV
jgi:hypothetical protein